MLTGFLHLHNVLRYLIIIAAVWAIIKLIQAKKANKPFGKSEKTPSLLYMIFMDIQLVLGVALFFFTNYITKLKEVAFSDWDKVSQFFLREHLPIMILSLIFVHIGHSAAKKSKYSKAITFFIISLVLIIAAVPWPFRDLGRGWIPGM